MNSTDPILFPCPSCGVGRGQGGIACFECGWDPDAVLHQHANLAKTSIASSGSSVFGAIAMAVGILLLIGATGFLLAVTTVLRNADLPVFVFVGPWIQIAMGLLSIYAGSLLFKSNDKGKWLFIVAVLVVMLNTIGMVVTFAVFVPIP